MSSLKNSISTHVGRWEGKAGEARGRATTSLEGWDSAPDATLWLPGGISKALGACWDHQGDPSNLPCIGQVKQRGVAYHQ